MLHESWLFYWRHHRCHSCMANDLLAIPEKFRKIQDTWLDQITKKLCNCSIAYAKICLFNKINALLLSFSSSYSLTCHYFAACWLAAWGKPFYTYWVMQQNKDCITPVLQSIRKNQHHSKKMAPLRLPQSKVSISKNLLKTRPFQNVTFMWRLSASLQPT